MLPNREGLFHAYPTAVGIDETGPNKLATCVISFSLFEELVDGQWVSCEDEKLEIGAWLYLERRDGALNTYVVDALKSAFNWDGRDPFWLQDTDLSQHPVQVRLAFEEFNGKQRLKVAYLNPYGSAPTGGVTKADENTRRSLNARLGAKLRALAGGTPAPAPKPAGRPLPAGKPAAPKPDPKAPAATATMESAWTAFTRACKPEWTREETEAEWFRILTAMFPDKKAEDLSPEEWGLVSREAPSRIIPF